MTRFEIGGGACAQGIVTGDPWDLGSRQQRTITYRNGDVATLLRGSVVLSVGLYWDGWLPEPAYTAEPRPDVTVSGEVTRVDYATGDVFMERGAGSIIAVSTEGGGGTPESTAFVKAGLTSFYQLTKGRLTEYVPADAQAVATLSLQKSSKLVNMCDVINRSAGRDHTVLVYASEGIGKPADY